MILTWRPVAVLTLLLAGAAALFTPRSLDAQSPSTLARIPVAVDAMW